VKAKKTASGCQVRGGTQTRRKAFEGGGAIWGGCCAGKLKGEKKNILHIEVSGLVDRRSPEAGERDEVCRF